MLVPASDMHVRMLSAGARANPEHPFHLPSSAVKIGSGINKVIDKRENLLRCHSNLDVA
jgi:hypothetical protein